MHDQPFRGKAQVEAPALNVSQRSQKPLTQPRAWPAKPSLALSLCCGFTGLNALPSLPRFCATPVPLSFTQASPSAHSCYPGFPSRLTESKSTCCRKLPAPITFSQPPHLIPTPLLLLAPDTVMWTLHVERNKEHRRLNPSNVPQSSHTIPCP